jgi:hypothetical protein
VKLPIFLLLSKAFILQQSKEIWNKERKFGTKKGNLEQRKEIWNKERKFGQKLIGGNKYTFTHIYI